MKDSRSTEYADILAGLISFGFGFGLKASKKSWLRIGNGQVGLSIKYNYLLPLASIFRMPMLALHVYTSHVDFTSIVNIYLHPLADSL